MSLFSRLRREIAFLKPTIRTLRRVGSIARESANLACDDVEAAVDRWPERIALSFEGRTLTYAAMDALANRYAHWARAQGMRRGDVVAVVLPNRLEYAPLWLGLTKVGVVAALVNNHLTGQPLAHCLAVAGARHVVVDETTAKAAAGALSKAAKPPIIWTLGAPHGQERDLATALKSASGVRPDRSVRDGMTAGDVALYVFTSGTTGLPKAARMTHMRVQLYMSGFAGATGSTADDVIYCALPLYHSTGGQCALGAALLNGGTFVVARQFSATRFWEDIAAAKATMFVYVGELCRFLVNQPERPAEREHHVRLAFGNGLGPDIWPKLKQRFAIPHILEFYGATEGNVSMFNFDEREGAIGRAPRYLRKRFNIRLIAFDVETEQPVRGPDGLCVECGAGEVGECVGEIGQSVRTVFAGYADKAASEKKVLHDVFRKGDRWFATGDLMRQDRDGYFYFVDRIGDTFRWKSENVSTSEVAARLAAVPGVQEAIVYGVQVGGMDGKGGMAALVAGPEFDIKALAGQLAGALPDYAQPLFVRLLPKIETTGTFKYRKMDLAADGFDPERVKGGLFYRNAAKGYLRLTRPAYTRVVSGETRL